MSHDLAVLVWLFNCLLASWNLGRTLPWWWDEYVPVDRGLRLVTTGIVLWLAACVGGLIWTVIHVW